MDNLIINHWNDEQRQLPGIDCIAFPDGHITILSFIKVYDPNTAESAFYCGPLCDTTINSIEKYNSSCWTMVDPWTVIECANGKIYGGEGQMGNEGFIAHTDHNDNLIWGMFFENTNPIKQLEIRNNILIAINEHSELKLEIDLNQLTEIKIASI